MTDETMSIVKSTSLRLASLLNEEGDYLYQASYKMEKLQLDLEWCRHILLGWDETKQHQNKSQEWISQIREFGYEAGVILDKYMLLISRAREQGFWNAVVRLSRADCEAKVLLQVNFRVDALSRRVNELASKMRFSGVRGVSSSNWIYTRSSITDIDTRARRKYAFVGFELNVAMLLTRLTYQHELSKEEAVVTIYGQPGSGKTTLANMVYHSKTARDHFDSFLWVPQQMQLNSRKVLELICLELYGGDYYDQKKKIKGLGLGKLKDMIEAGLRMKKLLLVLDEVRDDERSLGVVRIVSSLMNSFTASKIMLTTSSQAVQRVVANKCPSLLPPVVLSDKECQELLRNIIGCEEGNLDGYMKQWGNNMTQRCKNNPLAIVMLGGILASKKTKDEWKQVYNSISKIISVVEDVMELSWSDLPVHIRPCFLHLGNLPTNLEIPANQLYRIWVAEGLVSLPSDEGRRRPEDIAEDYLNELVERCLVEVMSRGKTGKVKAFRMHDFIRRFCQKRATEVNCYTISSTNIKEIGESSRSTTTTDQISGNTKACLSLANTLSTRTLHGLAVRVLDDHQESKSCHFPDEIIGNCQHLKSLLFLTNSDGALPRGWIKSLVGASKNLRVLHLEDAVIVSLPEQIGGLIHLMYLSLRGTRVAHGLPPSIGDLLLLETLDLRVFGMNGGGSLEDVAGARAGHYSVVLPNVFWMLKRLRNLFLPESYVCRMLRKLDLSGLRLLETLKNLNLRHCRVKGLSSLLALRKVSWKISDGDDMFEPRDKKTLFALLQSPSVQSGYLKKKLAIKMNGTILSDKNVNVLAALEGYKKSVEGLIIWGPLTSTLNSGSMKKVLAIEHLTSLVLRLTQLQDDPMPILETLRNLKNLRLSYRSFIGTKMTCNTGGFCRLVYLNLDMLPGLQEWVVKEEAMPELKLVEIDYCKELQRIPSELAETVEVHCLFPCILGHRTCPYYEEPRVDQDIAYELVSCPSSSCSSSAAASAIDLLVGVTTTNSDVDVGVTTSNSDASPGALINDNDAGVDVNTRTEGNNSNSSDEVLLEDSIKTEKACGSVVPINLSQVETGKGNYDSEYQEDFVFPSPSLFLDDPKGM